MNVLPSREKRRERQREPRRGRVAVSASLLALAARGFPAMLAFVAPSHNSLRSLRSLCSNTCDESEHEAREYARGHESSASRRRKGALPATRPRLCRGSALLVAGASPRWASRQAVLGGGDLWGAEREGRGSEPACAGLDGPGARCVSQRARSLGGGARTRALRKLTRRICLSAESAAIEASYATRPRGEHRKAVGAKRRPLHHEPLPGSACRDALIAAPHRTPPRSNAHRHVARPFHAPRVASSALDH